MGGAVAVAVPILLVGYSISKIAGDDEASSVVVMLLLRGNNKTARVGISTIDCVLWLVGLLLFLSLPVSTSVALTVQWYTSESATTCSSYKHS